MGLSVAKTSRLLHVHQRKYRHLRCSLGRCCEPRPPDVNGDDTVDVLDLLAVLAAWGQSDALEDITGDGIVDVLDLLKVLAAWGPCL